SRNAAATPASSRWSSEMAMPMRPPRKRVPRCNLSVRDGSREAPPMDPTLLPAYAELPVRSGLPPNSSWGVWSDHDVLGTLNPLSPERVLVAAGSIRTGRTFGLNLDVTLPD